MNYLAHSFLAFTDEQIVGQFLEDFIRNRERFSFPEGLYAGAFVDVSMDYFLANSLSDEVLKNHAEKVYQALRKYKEFLPEKLLKMVDGMEKDNWLYNYKEDWGIKYSIQNVLNKAKYLNKDLAVFEVFMNNKPQLQKHFEVFFPELLAQAEKMNSEF